MRPIRPTRPANRETGPVRPASAPLRGAARPGPRPIVPPAEPAPDVEPPLIASPEETDIRSAAVSASKGTSRAGGQPPGTARSRNLQNLEALLQESKAALQERDAALAKVAVLEDTVADANRRIENLAPLETRAAELQEQCDRSAAALAEAQREAEELKPFRAQAVELGQKLEAAVRMRSKLAQELAKLKSRLTTFEGQQKDLLERLKESETGRRKAETALANAKEMRNEYQYRLQAVQAAAQGDPPPPRTKQAEKNG